MGSVYLAVSCQTERQREDELVPGTLNAKRWFATRPGATSGAHDPPKIARPAPSTGAPPQVLARHAATKLSSSQIVTGSRTTVDERSAASEAAPAKRNPRNSANHIACCGSICTDQQPIR